MLAAQRDPSLRERIGELARKSAEGDLTAEDRKEYAGYVRANKSIAVLRRTSGRSAP
ncbi:hypothetical protein LBMAG56_46380 [Verrucomicrobiota bacterium]|nr:hypothetical protein LBMAG56_46380 [Verrucomicrobiota bacterium]